MSFRCNRRQLTQNKDECNTTDASVEQELFIIPEHLGSPTVIVGFALVNLQNGMFCRSLFILCYSSWSVLQFTVSSDPFGIFKLCVINIVLSDDGLMSTKIQSITQGNTRGYFLAKESMCLHKTKVHYSQRAIMLT